MVIHKRPAAFLAWLPVLLLVLPWALVACGGDDDDDGGGDDGSDEAYVSRLCGAMATMQEEFEDLGQPATLDEAQDFLEDAADIVQEAIDEIDGANPPGDVADLHELLVDTLQTFADAMKDGDLEALATFEPPDFSGDPDVEERFNAIAADVEDCQTAGIF